MAVELRIPGRSRLEASRSILSESEAPYKPPQGGIGQNGGMTESNSSQNSVGLQSKHSGCQSKEFERKWRAYMQTLLDSGRMLTGQTEINKQQLCNLLHRQIDICNEIFFKVSVAGKDEFTQMIDYVTLNNRNDFLTTQQLMAEMGRDPNLNLSNSFTNEQYRTPSGAEFVKRKSSPIMAVFDDNPIGEGPTLKDLRQPNSFNSHYMAHSVDYRGTDELQNFFQAQMNESGGLKNSQEFLRLNSFGRQPTLEEYAPVPRRLLLTPHENENAYMGDLPRGVSNMSAFQFACFQDCKESAKEPSTLEEIRQYPSNSSSPVLKRQII